MDLANLDQRRRRRHFDRKAMLGHLTRSSMGNANRNVGRREMTGSVRTADLGGDADGRCGTLVHLAGGLSRGWNHRESSETAPYGKAHVPESLLQVSVPEPANSRIGKRHTAAEACSWAPSDARAVYDRALSADEASRLRSGGR